MDDTPRMDTLTEVAERFRAAGYREDWYAEDGRLVCGTCRHAHDPATATVDEFCRFEGPSDPGDEQILFALTGECGHRGLYTPAYGTYASADDVAVVQELRTGE